MLVSGALLAAVTTPEQHFFLSRVPPEVSWRDEPPWQDTTRSCQLCCQLLWLKTES